MKESLKRTHPGVMTELLEHSFIHSVLAWSPFKAPSIILSADNTVVTQTHHGVLLWKGLSPWGDQRAYLVVSRLTWDTFQRVPIPQSVRFND